MVCSQGESLTHCIEIMFKVFTSTYSEREIQAKLEGNFFKNVDPLIAKAIKIAENKLLCKKEDLDLSKCRESSLLPGKALLFNKSGMRVAIDLDTIPQGKSMGRYMSLSISR